MLARVIVRLASFTATDSYLSTDASLHCVTGMSCINLDTIFSSSTIAGADFLSVFFIVIDSPSSIKALGFTKLKRSQTLV